MVFDNLVDIVEEHDIQNINAVSYGSTVIKLDNKPEDVYTYDTIASKVANNLENKIINNSLIIGAANTLRIISPIDIKFKYDQHYRANVQSAIHCGVSEVAVCLLAKQLIQQYIKCAVDSSISKFFSKHYKEITKEDAPKNWTTTILLNNIEQKTKSEMPPLFKYGIIYTDGGCISLPTNKILDKEEDQPEADKYLTKWLAASD